MKVLDRNEIKRILKEEIEKILSENEWGSRLKSLKTELDIFLKDEEEEPKHAILSKGFKIKSADGKLFTISKTTDDGIWAKSPKGKNVFISVKSLKKFKRG